MMTLSLRGIMITIGDDDDNDFDIIIPLTARFGSAGLKIPVFTRHTHFFRRAILTCKVCQTDVAFGVRSWFISKWVVCMQDYKSLCAAATVCTNLVNIQTHRQTACWPVYMNSSSSWAKYGESRCNMMWDHTHCQTYKWMDRRSDTEWMAAQLNTTSVIRGAVICAVGRGVVDRTPFGRARARVCDRPPTLLSSPFSAEARCDEWRMRAHMQCRFHVTSAKSAGLMRRRWHRLRGHTNLQLLLYARPCWRLFLWYDASVCAVCRRPHSHCIPRLFRAAP